MNKYTFQRIKEKVDTFFNPRQKWLTKVIPKTWCDKTELIPRILFTCLVDFVEGEEGLRQLNVDWTYELEKGYVTQEYIDKHNTDYGELNAVYQYIKNERPILTKKHEDSFPEIDFNKKSPWVMEEGKTYAEVYGENDRLEKLIDEMDLWAMQTIVKHYQILWT